MPEAQVVIENRMGLHVRPATRMADAAMRFQSAITVVKDGCSVDAKSPLELLTLAAARGTVLTLRAEGPDAEQALEALRALVAARFDEE
jgi:phosphocarrier protein HPr